MSRALRERYGAGPGHLIAVVVGLSIVGYALLQIAGASAPLSFVVFFAGAIVAHDLVAFPIYSALDRIAGGAIGTRGDDPLAINFVRVPALLSGFALIVWFPLILGLDTDRYGAATGHPPADYLARWLALTGVLFLVSGVAYAIRRRRLASAPDRDRATGPRGPRSPR